MIPLICLTIIFTLLFLYPPPVQHSEMVTSRIVKKTRQAIWIPSHIWGYQYWFYLQNGDRKRVLYSTYNDYNVGDKYTYKRYG